MKRFFLVFLVIFSFSHIFAEFDDGKITKFVEFDMTSTTNKGIERYNTLFSGEVGAIAPWWEAVCGVQAYEDVFDFTVRGTGWFPFASWQFETSRIAIGGGLNYHFQRYRNTSSENDYMLFSTFRYKNLGGTTITFFCGFLGKSTKIDALSDNVPFIHDKFADLALQINKIWQKGLELYVEHGIFDFYRYPHFCAPHYLIGAAYNFDTGLRFGCDISVRIVDGYATAPYADSLLLKLSARYSF